MDYYIIVRQIYNKKGDSNMKNESNMMCEIKRIINEGNEIGINIMINIDSINILPVKGKIIVLKCLVRELENIYDRVMEMNGWARHLKGYWVRETDKKDIYYNIDADALHSIIWKLNMRLYWLEVKALNE